MKKIFFIFLLLLPQVLYASDAHPRKDKIFYASFDGSITADVSKGAPEGTFKNGVPRYERGKSGLALRLEGNETLWFATPGNFPVKEGTVLFWIQPVSWNFDKSAWKVPTFFFVNGTGGGWILFYNYISADNIRVLFRPGDFEKSGKANSPGGPFAANWKNGEWHQMGFCWKQGDGCSLIVDRKLLFTDKTNPYLPVERWDAYFNIHPGAEKGVATLFDEFTIYDRALSASELASTMKLQEPPEKAKLAEKFLGREKRKMGEVTPKIPLKYFAQRHRIFAAGFDGKLDADEAKGAAKSKSSTGKIAYGPGLIGKALYMDGNANITYESAKNLLPAQGTVSFWTKAVDYDPDALAPGFFSTYAEGQVLFLCYRYHGNSSISVLFRHEDFEKTGNASFPNSSIQGQWKPNEWHNIAFTWNSTIGVNLYIDGERRSSVGGGFVPAKEYVPFSITGAEGKKMAYDEFRIYDRDLPDEVIHQMYNSIMEPDEAERPAIEMVPIPYPSYGKMQLRLDLADMTYIPREDNVNAILEILSEKKGKKIGEAKFKLEGKERFRTNIDVEKMEPGNYSIKLDFEGVKLGGKKITYKMEALPDWFTTDFGVSDKIYPPFKPMQLDGSSIGVVGRRYHFADSPLPTGVEREGSEMLAAPIHFEGSVNGKKLEKPAGSFKAGEHNEGKVLWDGTLDYSGTLKLNVSGWMEYDGCAWFECTFNPKADANFDELALVIPMKTEFAKLVHSSPRDCNSYIARSFTLPQAPGGWEKPKELGKLSSMIWVGDDKGGLCWFSEDTRGWNIADELSPDMVDFVTDGKTTNIIIKMITKPSSRKGERKISFGLLATPTKPLPDKWRTRLWRHGDDSKRFGYVSYWFNQAGAPFDWLDNYSGWIIPKDITFIKNAVDGSKKAGLRGCVYSLGGAIAAGHPDMGLFGAEWSPKDFSYDPSIIKNKLDLLEFCPDSSVQNLIAFTNQNLSDRVPNCASRYYDGVNLAYCMNEMAGHGYRDEEGVLHGMNHFLGVRDMFKRNFVIFKEHEQALPTIMIHHSSTEFIPAFSFGQVFVTGENLTGQMNPDDPYVYAKLLPLEKIRSEFANEPWGVLCLFLAEQTRGAQPFFHKEWTKENLAESMECMMAHLLLVETGIWPNFGEAALSDKWYGIQDEFGMEDANFTGFWDADSYINESTGGVHTSYYSKPNGKRLLICSNISEKNVSGQLNIDWKKLGLSGKPKSAKDLWRDKAIAISEQGISIELTKYHFAAVLLEP